jgi:hypothetical protein
MWENKPSAAGLRSIPQIGVLRAIRCGPTAGMDRALAGLSNDAPSPARVTAFGIECLEEIIAIEREAGRAPPNSARQSNVPAVPAECSP